MTHRQLAIADAASDAVPVVLPTSMEVAGATAFHSLPPKWMAGSEVYPQEAALNIQEGEVAVRLMEPDYLDSKKDDE
jgi:hypothetical protein